MSNRIQLGHKAVKEDIPVYYHPTLELWTPNTGEPVTLHVYGSTAMRSGINRWITDLVDVPEGELHYMYQKELRSLVAALKVALSDTFPEIKINEIVQDVIQYAR